MNDDFTSPFSIADAQGKLPREPRSDPQDTTDATVQADLFSPETGGGPEPTTCKGVAYGRTIWYDVVPDVSGVLRLQSAGRDGVVSVFDLTGAARPALGPLVACANNTGITDTLEVYVRKGKRYTVQLGGVDAGAGPAGGQIQFTEVLAPDTDGDGRPDAVDKCPTLPGRKADAGCPPTLELTPVFRFAPDTGVISALTVTSDAGATVSAACCGVKQKAAKLKKAGTVSLDHVVGHRFSVGASITLTVTAKGAIGSQTVFTRRGKKVARKTSCLYPGSLTKHIDCP